MKIELERPSVPTNIGGINLITKPERKNLYRQMYLNELSDLYQFAFGIDISSPEFVVHHISRDRNMNMICNLVALPQKIHRLYHCRLNALIEYSPYEDFEWEHMYDFIGGDVDEEFYYLLRRLIPVRKECVKWKNMRDILILPKTFYYDGIELPEGVKITKEYWNYLHNNVL